jgi:hypothetical protein
MFAGKARAYPNEAPFKGYTLGWAPGLTHTHTQTHITLRLVGLARDKNSSSIRKSVNYGQKSFIALAPGACIIKLISAVIYGVFNKLECLSLKTR